MQQVEQDLLICRTLVAIYSDEFLSSRLAFRGGTALHKLYLSPQPRYSEDIDLVQISSEPFGSLLDRLRETLSFLGTPQVKQHRSNNTAVFRVESTFPPTIKLRLKVETNCKEHFSVFGFKKIPFSVETQWFSGACEITTYCLEELVGTKVRALYQRKKGRDLFDLHKALETGVDINAVLRCYSEYITFSDNVQPTKEIYLANLEAKMRDDGFLGDTLGILRPSIAFDPQKAFSEVALKLIARM
jgi:predicted nucleotidyltransferase component of viral defense system